MRKQVVIGQEFGKLTVEKFVSSGPQGRLWLCKCECGKFKNATTGALNSGQTWNCGCHRNALSSERATRHGLSQIPEYFVWQTMKARCTNKKHRHFGSYGGRGIKVCDRWMTSFQNFISDMGRRTSSKHSIDRIDNEGNYSPENCRWATAFGQGKNRRNNKHLTFKGETLIASEWARRIGITRTVLSDRLSRMGWSLERALTEPLNKRSA